MLPRDAANDARRVSHVNTAVSRCRNAWQLRVQTDKADLWRESTGLCHQRRTLSTDSLRGERFRSSSINHPLFMEPGGSLPSCQQPATCSCPEPKESSSHLTSCSFKIPFEITLPSTSKSCQWFFPWAYPNKTLYVYLLPTCHDHFNLLRLITGVISGD